MTGFWTLGILIIAGVFALLLILNPNLSWTVKRFSRPIYPLFRRRRDRKNPAADDYGFRLSNGKDEAPASNKEKSP